MDQRSNKRSPGRTVTTKKVDQNAQPCNRTGCSGQRKNGQNSMIGNLDKSKYPNLSFRTSIGNETTRKPVVNSSITTTNGKGPYTDSKTKLRSQVKFVPSDVTRCGSSSASSSNVGPRKKSHRPISSYVSSASKSSERGQYNSESTMKKRSLEGESSSSRGERKTTTALPVSVDSPIRRSMNVNTRTRAYNRQNRRNSSSVTERAVAVSETCDNELLQFSASGSRSLSLSGNNSDNPSDTMPFASEEHEFMHFMTDDDMFRQFDMGGINEMLLDLERIEQEEESTLADILELETSLFLGGLNLYDQHREMRLDIDDMSYEDLLALEDRMGTVSTAIPQAAISKCITKSLYKTGPSKVQITGSVDDGDEIKCSICQEEYVTGDEIGTLVECKHGYHAKCINRWLQLKNWCPVCKTSVASSLSAPSL